MPGGCCFSSCLVVFSPGPWAGLRLQEEGCEGRDVAAAGAARQSTSSRAGADVGCSQTSLALSLEAPSCPKSLHVPWHS